MIVLGACPGPMSCSKHLGTSNDTVTMHCSCHVTVLEVQSTTFPNKIPDKIQFIALTVCDSRKPSSSNLNTKGQHKATSLQDSTALLTPLLAHLSEDAVRQKLASMLQSADSTAPECAKLVPSPCQVPRTQNHMFSSTACKWRERVCERSRVSLGFGLEREFGGVRGTVGVGSGSLEE